MDEKQFFYFLLVCMFILAAITFASLLFMTAPYGRYARKGWGRELNAKLAWFIQELPSVVVFAFFFFLGEYKFQAAPIIFLVLWQIHYVNRTFIYPFRIRGGKTTPFITFLMAFLFTGINGYLNARYITHFSGGYSLEWLYDPRFITGVAVFFAGLFINLHSDRILRNLRKEGEQDYKMPAGGIFKYVSCGNYFGEILEWTGFAIATWSLPGLCFAVWTGANLIPRALSHHKFYKNQFSEYPPDRKAIIPFIL